MDTTSIALSCQQWETLWGPRQHLCGDNFYLLPIDEYEYRRLSFEQYVFKIAFGRAYFAPLEKPESILDVGCGPGNWCFDMCRSFPGASVVGLDINAVQPAFHPINYQFVQGSVLDPLPFADNSFDYVHQSLMYASIPAPSWKFVLSELIRVIKPGGYLELVEVSDGLATLGPASAKMARWMQEVERLHGISLHMLDRLPNMVDVNGAITLFHQVIWLPLGERAGRTGILMTQNIGAFFASMACKIEECLAVPAQVYRRAWEEMLQEWSVLPCAGCPFSVTVAQKTVPGLRQRLYPGLHH